MKKISIILAMGLLLLVAACGSSKSAVTSETSPVETFILPCMDCLKKDSVIRVWAIGKSDTEATARKKARTMGAAELAAKLEMKVKSTIDDYSATLSESDAGLSKSLLVAKTSIVVNKTVTGAAIVCDKWTKDEATGQYTNYIVMEISPSDYVDNLQKEMEASREIDKALLQRIFMQKIMEQ